MKSAPLVGTFLDCIRRGERAVVEDPGYLEALGLRRGRLSAGEVWWHLFEKMDGAGIGPRVEEGTRMSALLRRGPLARQILRALDVEVDRGTGPAPFIPRNWLQEVYEALAACLDQGELFVV
jgi:hypothetical protein